jgi:hypothetical protein
MSDTECLARLSQIQYTQHPFPVPPKATIIAWQFFNISSSQLLLPLLVAALYFSKPRAPAALINVILTWIIWGMVASVLLYSGHAFGCEPPPLLCLADASLYIALPTMATLAIFNAVLQIWFDVREKLALSVDEKDHTIRRVTLLVTPYIIYAIFATAVAASGASNFETIVSRTRRTFYCSVRSSFLISAIIGFSGLVLILTGVFTIWICVLLKQNWTRLHRSVNSRLDFSYIFRMFAFYIYTFIAMLMSFLPEEALIVEDMSMALMGYVILIIFATRKSVLEACLTHLNCFYRFGRAKEGKAADKMHIIA